jgi:hypothetical protein
MKANPGKIFVENESRGKKLFAQIVRIDSVVL